MEFHSTFPFCRLLSHCPMAFPVSSTPTSTKSQFSNRPMFNTDTQPHRHHHHARQFSSPFTLHVGPKAPNHSYRPKTQISLQPPLIPVPSPMHSSVSSLISSSTNYLSRECLTTCTEPYKNPSSISQSSSNGASMLARSISFILTPTSNFPKNSKFV